VSTEGGSRAGADDWHRINNMIIQNRYKWYWAYDQSVWQGDKTRMMVDMSVGEAELRLAKRERGIRVDKAIVKRISGEETRAELENIAGFGPPAPTCDLRVRR